MSKNRLWPGFHPDLAEEAHDAPQISSWLEGNRPRFLPLAMPLGRVGSRNFKYIRAAANADEANSTGLIATASAICGDSFVTDLNHVQRYVYKITLEWLNWKSQNYQSNWKMSIQKKKNVRIGAPGRKSFVLSVDSSQLPASDQVVSLSPTAAGIRLQNVGYTGIRSRVLDNMPAWHFDWTASRVCAVKYKETVIFGSCRTRIPEPIDAKFGKFITLSRSNGLPSLMGTARGVVPRHLGQVVN